MILVYVGTILVMLAWFSGRSVSGYEYRFRRAGLGLVGLLLLVHIVVIFLVPGRDNFQGVLLVFSQLIVIGLMALNHHLPGLKLAAVGVALNALVMLANGWLMPIPVSTYEYVYPARPAVVEHERPPTSKNVALKWEEITMPWLADIIPTPWLWRWYAISLGDIVLMVGLGWFLLAAPSRVRRRRCRRPLP